MTLNQALHALLIKSANDAAVAIAEHIGGSVEGFADMMNEEAQAIGATNSHFVNPHGLNAENHYVTAYDMYLIFNEALKYDTVNEIISMTSYDTVYTDKNGNEKTLSVKNTNQYLAGNVAAPGYGNRRQDRHHKCCWKLPDFTCTRHLWEPLYCGDFKVGGARDPVYRDECPAEAGDFLIGWRGVFQPLHRSSGKL